jgi:hypothetical protein
MALSVEDYIRIAEIQNRPKSLKELILPEAVRFGSQALGAGVGHLFGGGGRADEEQALNQRLADLYAGREWNAQNYEAQLAHQMASGIGAMKRRLQHAGLENYAKEFGINVDPTLYVPPALPQTFQTAYQDARGMGVNPLAGTELDTSGRGGGGGWKKWLPVAAMAASFIPGVGPALSKALPALGTLFGLGGGGGITGGPESWNPGITGPIIPSGSLPPWNPPSRGIQY